jgi:hypothetical protein
VFVCVLLGSGGLLLCSGGVVFGVRSGGNDIFDIYDCCYAAGAFSLGSVLGPLLGNDIYIKSSLFLGSVLERPPQGPTVVGTGNGTPEVPELPSAWGYS